MQEQAEEGREWLAETAGWPPALVKSACDRFTYALGLRSGLVIEFSECAAVRLGEWARLMEARIVVGPGLEPGYVFDRGVEVRVSEILWVADAPYGS